MAVNPAPVSSIIQIMRNVTGRTDALDPSFTDTIMLEYLNNFIQREHPQEVRIFQNRSWWEFTIDENTVEPYNVDLDALSFSTIEPPAYVGGFQVFWYQDPTSFFQIFPETQTYERSRPTYILYYNNQLIFRNPPDDEYTVKIATYKIDISFDLGDNIPNAYLYRYFAYGAGLDIFADYGEMDRYGEIFQVYQRYKGQVLARTWNQMMCQRSTPTF